MSDPHFLVRLDLLASSDGGRQTPIVDGYRPQWNIGALTETGEPMTNDATVRLDAELAPGESADVKLLPHMPRFWAEVAPGDELIAQEGGKIVGRAVVLCVEPADGS